MGTVVEQTRTSCVEPDLPQANQQQLSLLGPLNGQLHVLDQIVIHFIRFYNRLVSIDNSIVSFIAKVSMSNRMSYLRMLQVERANTLRIQVKG